MFKPISRKQHVLADYAYVAAAGAGPRLARFQRDKKASTIASFMSTAALGQSMMTRAEWGLVPLLPFKAHLAMDYVLGALTVGAPWLFGFSRDRKARNLFVGMGVAGLAATLLTRSDEMEEWRSPPEELSNVRTSSMGELDEVAHPRTGTERHEPEQTSFGF